MSEFKRYFKNVMLILAYILGLILLTFLPACNKEGFLQPNRNIELDGVSYYPIGYDKRKKK